MKPVAVPAPPVAAPPVAAAPASKPAAKTVQKPADPKPAPTVKAAEPASAKAAKPDPAAAGSAASKVQPPPGVTTYFGQTPALGEIQARPNPDYKPAIQSVEPNTAAVAAVVAATPPASVPVASVPVVEALPPPLPVGPPGVTSFFGEGKATSEMIAVANPDYKPAPPIAAVIDQPPARPALVEPPRQPSIPGITTFFGTKAGPAEQSAKPNPDYKPAPADVVAAPPPVAPMTPAAAVPAPPAVASSTGVEVCRTAVADAVKSGTVLFKSAKADLKSTSLPTLDAIAAAFKSCPDARLRIEGHTDNSGLADMNQKLSEARAQAVSSFLVGKGIEANRISAAGFGLSRPLVPNSTPANKARNRRIEFIVDAL